jgi:hypothetical protein
MSPVHEPSRDRSASLLCRVLKGVAYLLLVVAIVALLPDYYVLPQTVGQMYGAAGWYYAYGLWLNAFALGGTAISLLILRRCRQGGAWLPTPARILLWGVGLLFVGKWVFGWALELGS